MVGALVAFQHVEGLANAGQHAQRQHIHFHDAERVDVVLVPFDEGALVHGGIADGHGFGEGALCQHEAADMLGQVAREPDQLTGQEDGPADQRAARVQGIVPAAPDAIGQCAGNILAEAKHLADFPDGGAGPVGNHRRRQGGAVPAIPSVDILDDFLAAFMLEIDIDVRRLPALA